MTAHTPFSLADLEATCQMIGDLEFTVDPLNGATVLFCHPGMIEAAAKIVSAYNESAWSPRTIRIVDKTVIPEGHIVGFRQPMGDNGPYIDAVFMVTPTRTVPDPEVVVKSQELAAS